MRDGDGQRKKAGPRFKSMVGFEGGGEGGWLMPTLVTLPLLENSCCRGSGLLIMSWNKEHQLSDDTSLTKPAFYDHASS